MNIDFIPILGEYNPDEKNMVMNILSYCDINLKLDFISYDEFSEIREKETFDVELKKFTAKQIIFENIISKKYKIIFNNKDELNIIIPKNLTSNINIFNCDCHFVPETGIWGTIENKETNISFHLGDQIYLDLIFLDLCSKLQGKCCSPSKSMTDFEIRKDVYNVYKEAFLRKKNILQGSFNIMLGDDHDICDESLRKKYNENIVERVIKIFKEIYYEIQSNLRVNKSHFINFNDQTYLLMDNVRCLSTEKYEENIFNLINENKNNIKNKLYILSPRIIVNYSLDKISKLIYDSKDNTHDYTDLYDLIFKLNCKSVDILCGDEHTVKKMEITCKNTNKKCNLYLVGTINSVLDIYKCDNFLTSSKYDIKDTYMYSYHGYISINNGNVQHNIFKRYVNKLFAWIIYGVKIFYHK